jgi:hypothetical protein
MQTLSSFAQAIFPCLSSAEPPLHELLGDPITRLLMASDRLSTTEVGSILAQAKRELRA